VKGSLDNDRDIVAALQLTADPPRAWIETAALIPSALGDLDQIERLVASPAFREHFAADPAGATSSAGLPVSAPILSALRELIG
jgi:hypothetical protein